MLCVIDTTSDVVFLEIAGVHSDWTTYKFEIDVNTPGKKIIAFRVKQGLLTAETAQNDCPQSQKVEDTSDMIRVTATECCVLAKVTRTTNEGNPDLKGPLRTVGYTVRPIAGPEQTIEEFLELERARKRAKFSH